MEIGAHFVDWNLKQLWPQPLSSLRKQCWLQEVRGASCSKGKLRDLDLSLLSKEHHQGGSLDHKGGSN